MSNAIKGWWSEDGEWFCIRVNDGTGQATVSLRLEEARATLNALADNFNEKIKALEPTCSDALPYEIPTVFRASRP